jgi:hypothetical protein
MKSHYPDYISALTRVEKTRTLLISGSPQTAGQILKKGYVFAVLSIRTGLERHERSFTKWVSGADIREAATGTVYGNQKGNWMNSTIKNTDWKLLGEAAQCHLREGRVEKLLESVVSDLKGVSHRKGAFMLAMSGVRELICIDSNVAQFAGLTDEVGNALSFTSAEEYLTTSDSVLDLIPNPLNLPPFLLQWVVYDWQRGEHARHAAFYREVLPEYLSG